MVWVVLSGQKMFWTGWVSAAKQAMRHLLRQHDGLWIEVDKTWSSDQCWHLQTDKTHLSQRRGNESRSKKCLFRIRVRKACLWNLQKFGQLCTKREWIIQWQLNRQGGKGRRRGRIELWPNQIAMFQLAVLFQIDVATNSLIPQINLWRQWLCTDLLGKLWLWSTIFFLFVFPFLFSSFPSICFLFSFSIKAYFWPGSFTADASRDCYPPNHPPFLGPNLSNDGYRAN